MRISTTPQGPPPVAPDPSRMSRAGWHLRANAPLVFWLVALVFVVAAHRVLPVSTWLMVHLLLLGGIGNAVMVWSSHFAEALLRGPGRGRTALAWRLVGLNLGVGIVVTGMVADIWVLVLCGSILVGSSYAWHGASLAVRAARALPSRFGATVRYYICASWLLPVGAGLGAIMALGPSGADRDRLLVAHTMVNILGFVGLTVLGTLATLLPTMLRTRVAEGAETVVRAGWMPLLLGTVIAGAGAGGGWTRLVGAGLVVYVVGIAYAIWPMCRAMVSKPSTEFAPLSAGASLLWLAAAVALLAVEAGRGPSWAGLHADLQGAVPALAAGFAAQVLMGALSYLVPVVAGGGPATFKARRAILNNAAGARWVIFNAGLGVALLPVPGGVRAAASSLVLVAFVWFLVLLLGSLRSARRQAHDPAP